MKKNGTGCSVPGTDINTKSSMLNENSKTIEHVTSNIEYFTLFLSEPLPSFSISRRDRLQYRGFRTLQMIPIFIWSKTSVMFYG